ERNEAGRVRGAGAGSAEEHGLHALISGGADVVAAAEEKSPAVDRDAAVHAHVGAQALDYPDLSAGIHAAYDICGAVDARRYDADSAFEANEAIVRGGLACMAECCKRQGCSDKTHLHGCSSRGGCLPAVNRALPSAFLACDKMTQPFVRTGCIAFPPALR